MSPIQHARSIFEKEFGIEPRVFVAPGRINLIGEHTDYNGGFVLPAAVDKYACLAIGPATGNKGTWISADFKERVEIDFTRIEKHSSGWANYLLGVLDQFVQDGRRPSAFHAVLSSDIPIGSGLSSSAAIESVTAMAVNEREQWGYSLREMAEIAQRAEHAFIGVKVGIMDMYASLHGRAGQVMRLDCRAIRHEYFPLFLGPYEIVLLDTGVKHELASSEYNVRRQQCEEGVAMLQQHYPEVRQLRDVTTEMLLRHKEAFDPVIYRRCYFVVEENNRVDQVCDLLRHGSLDQAGQLLYASHAGLQYDYEVSCRELDLLVKLVKDETFVLGARMMGGGFGGCTINIVHRDAVDVLMKKIAPVYRENTGKELHSIAVVTADGAREISLSS